MRFYNTLLKIPIIPEYLKPQLEAFHLEYLGFLYYQCVEYPNVSLARDKSIQKIRYTPEEISVKILKDSGSRINYYQYNINYCN